jgi:kynurenine 3-monooxygenase
MQKSVTIVGAGLAGSLCALYLTKRGYKVAVYERRKDLRSEIITAGKSINLALSERGWTALKKVGVDREVMKIAIPMHKRIMHDVNGELTEQLYGNKGQAIYSVSRAQLNIVMMKLAEENGVDLYFNEKCVDVDFKKSKVFLNNTINNEKREVKFDFLIGSDGAFSAVRNQMIKQYSHEYSYDKIDHDYKELHIPASSRGNFLLEKNALHIWPRGNFMLIALANLDGSFTCTLFAPKKGKNSFKTLNTKDRVEKYFTDIFPDFFELVPNLYEQWNANPTSSLGVIKTFPWHFKDKAILIGDAAHATVPFYGQGMNASLEDCRILDELLDKYGDNLNNCFSEYSKLRRPEGDGLQALSLHNFIVMRDKTADPHFLLQKKIEQKFGNLYPDKWIPLYSMVSFTNIPYSEAWIIGLKQEKIMQKIMQIPNLEKKWDQQEVMDAVLDLL